MHSTSSQPDRKQNNNPLTGKAGSHGTDQVVLCANRLKQCGLLLRCTGREAHLQQGPHRGQ
jgi:hypothetical protein